LRAERNQERREKTRVTAGPGSKRGDSNTFLGLKTNIGGRRTKPDWKRLQKEGGKGRKITLREGRGGGITSFFWR